MRDLPNSIDIDHTPSPHAQPRQTPGAIAAKNPGDTPTNPSPVSGRGQILGYARVSRSDQNLDRQRDALLEAGCARIFADEGISGSLASRPGLDDLLAFARPGDVIVVQALDRLGRSTRNLLTLVDELGERAVALRILNLGVDTSTAAGKLVLTVIGALAEMERSTLRERTLDGLAAARARGRVGGRPPVLSRVQKTEVMRMREAGRTTAEIAEILQCSTRTVRRVPR